MRSPRPVRRRRRLPALLTLICLAALLPTLAPPATAQEEPIQQMRAVWADALHDGFRNHEQVDELFNNIVRANANTLFMQVRRHGNTWYNSPIEPRSADPKLAPAEVFDPLGYALARGKQMGIKVHAWVVVSVTCRPHDLLWGHPQHICTHHGPTAADPERWTTATYGGTQVGDLDFGHPAAIQYMEHVVMHLLSAYPELDGIHWDFIRTGGESYGYNRVSVERFNLAHGRAISSRPVPGDPAWKQWRRDRITELARRLYIRSKAINPRIEVSAATITWGGLGTYHPNDWPNSAAYDRVFQDWRGWLEEGILDFAVPMHYFSESNTRQREWYNGWLAWDRANVGRRAIVPGIGAWLNNTDENLAQIMRAFTPDDQGRHLAGVAIYSYDQPIRGGGFEPRRAYMDRLRNTVFAQPAKAPEWPWIVNPTGGHLQGIAAIDGQIMPNAKVSLVHNGSWLRDIYSSADGWYGAVELPPGAYTIIVHDPANPERQAFYDVAIQAGFVTNGP